MSAMYKRVAVHRKHDGKYIATLSGRNAMEFEVWLTHGKGVATFDPVESRPGFTDAIFVAKDSLIGCNGDAYPVSSLVTTCA